MSSGNCDVVPGVSLGASEKVNNAKLNLGFQPSVRVGVNQITSREISDEILPFDVKQKTVLFDDFINAVDTGSFQGTTYQRAQTSGTGAVIEGSVTRIGRPGIRVFKTGTTSSGYAVIRGLANNNWLNLGSGGGEVYTEIAVQMLSEASDDTNTATIIAGLGEGATGAAEPASGVYFHYTHSVNSGNWVAKTASSSTRTSVNSAVALDLSTWYRLGARINANATSVEFFINGTSIGTSTTNIPIGVGLGWVLGIRKSAGTSERRIEADYLLFSQTFTTDR